MYIAVTLDRLGERYGLLPSEVLERATTLDIMVMDLSISYEHSKEKRRQGALPNIKQEKLIEGLKKFKEKN